MQIESENPSIDQSTLNMLIQSGLDLHVLCSQIKKNSTYHIKKNDDILEKVDVLSKEEEINFMKLSKKEKINFLSNITGVKYIKNQFILNLKHFENWFKYMEHVLTCKLYTTYQKCVFFGILDCDLTFVVFESVSYRKVKDYPSNKNIPNMINITLPDKYYNNMKQMENLFTNLFLQKFPEIYAESKHQITNLFVKNKNHPNLKRNILSINQTSEMDIKNIDGTEREKVSWEDMDDYGYGQILLKPKWAINTIDPYLDLCVHLGDKINSLNDFEIDYLKSIKLKLCPYTVQGFSFRITHIKNVEKSVIDWDFNSDTDEK